jgi:predicted DNA binding CopG/RHH family protein
MVINKESVKKYKKANIKRIPLEMQISKYNLLKQKATEKGIPINTFIKKAIDEYIKE